MNASPLVALGMAFWSGLVEGSPPKEYYLGWSRSGPRFGNLDLAFEVGIWSLQGS